MKLDPRNRLLRGVHIKLMVNTHAQIRVALFLRKLAMQEIFEEFANLIILEDPRAIKILDDLAEKKRLNEIKKLSRLDADTLLDEISITSPCGPPKEE